MGKYHKVNIDNTSVSPSYYSAGGFKSVLNRDTSQRNSGANLTSDSIQILQFPNGKQVEHQRPGVALHEVQRKARKKQIEYQNYKLATKLYTARAAINNTYETEKAYVKHQKLKSLRCKFPIIDMSKNIFHPNKSVFVDKDLKTLQSEKVEFDKLQTQTHT